MSMLDLEKDDGIMGEKINQSALNNILFKITSYDEHASSAYEIDSQKEVDRLGSYLNGQIDSEDCEYYGLPTKEELNKDENKDIYEYLKNLYDSVKDKFTTPKGEKSISDIEALGSKVESSSTKKIKNKEYTETVNAITKDNVSDINPSALEALSSNYYLSEKGVKDDKIKEGQKHIEKLLLDKAKELEVSQDEIDEATSQKERAFEVYVRYLINAIQKKENEIAEKNEIDKAEEYEKEKEKDKLTVPSTEKDANSPQAKLQNACNAYVKENGINDNLNDQGRRSNFGDHRRDYNGEIEVGGATQQTGNCWFMAGLNSVAAVEQNASSDSNETEETSVSLSENIYRDQKHGVTAVRLPEAAAKGKGYNGEGIYFVPDKAVNVKNSDGDLDVGAYNSAVEQYFEETGEDTYLNSRLREAGFEVSRLDGNTTSRAFEIMSGKETVTEGRLRADSDKIVKTETVTYEDVVKTHEDGAAIVLGVKIAETVEALSGTKLNLSKDVKHAFSVVGVDESGNIVLQESNNSEEVARLFKNSYQTENGTWNIVVTPDEFRKISFVEASAMKVK